MKNPKKFWQTLIPLALFAWGALNFSSLFSAIPYLKEDISNGMLLKDFLSTGFGLTLFVALIEIIFAVLLYIKQSVILLRMLILLLIVDILAYFFNFGYFSGGLPKEMFSINQIISVCLPQIILIVLILIGRKQYSK